MKFQEKMRRKAREQIENYICNSLVPSVYRIAVKYGMTQIGEDELLAEVLKDMKGETDYA